MNLPDGLTVNHASGLISGTPTKAGNYVVPMAANNSAGSGQADLIIDVGPPAVTKPPQLLNISTRMRVLPRGQRAYWWLHRHWDRTKEGNHPRDRSFA